MPSYYARRISYIRLKLSNPRKNECFSSYLRKTLTISIRNKSTPSSKALQSFKFKAGWISELKTTNY